jgi:hypothetical protein
MKKFVTLCLAIALASFTNVGADTSTSVVAPAAGTSVSSGAASSNANFFSKFKLNLNSNWNGGNFGSIFGKKDSLGNYTTNELAPSIGFKIAPKTTISASATMVTDSNKFSVINAPYLKVAQSGLISIGKFNVDNALRYYPRLTKDIKSAGIHHLFRNDLNSTYSLGSVVTLGCLLSPRFYIRDKAAGKTTFKMVVNPNIDIALSDNVSVNVGYMMTGIHKVGTKFFSGFADATGYGDAKYGVLEVSPTVNYGKLSLSPWVDYYPTLSTDYMQIGANMNLSVL